MTSLRRLWIAGAWALAASAAATAEQVRKIGQLVVGAQFQKQIEHFVEHFQSPRVAAIDLVDNDNRLQPALQRLA